MTEDLTEFTMKLSTLFTIYHSEKVRNVFDQQHQLIVLSRLPIWGKCTLLRNR